MEASQKHAAWVSSMVIVSASAPFRIRRSSVMTGTTSRTAGTSQPWGRNRRITGLSVLIATLALLHGSVDANSQAASASAANHPSSFQERRILQGLRIVDFLDSLVDDVYPEMELPQTRKILETSIPWFLEIAGFTVHQRKSVSLLDIGCGRGEALEMFDAHGIQATGITMGEADLIESRKKGLDVRKGNMHELLMPSSKSTDITSFQRESFDLVFARHVLEHSPMPYLVLQDIASLLKPGGSAYIELPMADKKVEPMLGKAHADNSNHYSILSEVGWLSLIRRCGLIVRSLARATFETSYMNSTDSYMILIATKPSAHDLFLPQQREKYAPYQGKVLGWSLRTELAKYLKRSLDAEVCFDKMQVETGLRLYCEYSPACTQKREATFSDYSRKLGCQEH